MWWFSKKPKSEKNSSRTSTEPIPDGTKQLYHCPSCGTIAENFCFRCVVCNKLTCYHCGFNPHIPNEFDHYCPQHKIELRNAAREWLTNAKQAQKDK